MKTAIRTALAVTLAGLALPLHAEEFIDNRVYVSPMFAYTFYDKDRGSKVGLGGYLGVGKMLNKHWNAELGGFYSRFADNPSRPGSQKMTDLGLKLDGQFFYSREKVFSPYFGLGGGVQRTKLTAAGVEDTQPMVDAGAGFISWFSVTGLDIALRADARYRWAFLDQLDTVIPGIDPLSGPIIKLGLVIPVGAKPVVATAATSAAAGAAAAAAIDADGDGVSDAADRCPGSTRGAVVDSNGCPRDVTGERQFDDVLFAFDNSNITPAGQKILDSASEAVNSGASRSLRINISGHTDSVGSDSYNQALSERRANVVRAYLVKKGVDASRIQTFAYGESTPKADNQEEAGRALNRRAEIKTATGE